jgi:hypothetical protein
MFLGKYAFLASHVAFCWPDVSGYAALVSPMSMNPHIVNPALASVARDALFSMLVRAAGTRPAR